MKNPFEYGGVVAEEAFCNRQRELADLGRAIENHEKLFVFSERRLGKTSLARAALRRLPPKQCLGAYVDLWPTDGEAAFVCALAKAVATSLSTSGQRLLETARSLFGRLAPKVTLDEEGKPTLGFEMSKRTGLALELDEVLEAPARIAARRERSVVVVFDEFQQILEYGSELVERKLRSVIQNHRNVAYLFLGSRRHLIQSMFTERARPLYRAAAHYPLGPIAEEHWLPFVRTRFERANKGIGDEHVRAVCRLTQGHPFYTQHLCHVLWEICEEDRAVTDGLIQAAVGVLLQRENYAYTALWDSLSLPQKRFLKGLAAEPGGNKPFSGEFIGNHGLGSASTAQRAAQALMQKDLVDRENGAFSIMDRFLRLWIQKVQLG